MSTEIVPLGTVISRRHREKLDAIKAKTRIPIRALIEQWIETAAEANGLTRRKRRAKAQ